MDKKTLHITNGTSATNYLKELDFTGDILTWEEMLCEGPAIANIDSKEFLNIRKSFLNTFYDADLDVVEFHEELDKLNHSENYLKIVLWFEYDLFCHINMIAIISLLRQKKITLPLFLVCSGRIQGKNNLKGLSELNSGQLIDHYNNKTKLTEEDIELASTLWGIYCGKDHNLFIPYIIKSSGFQYLNNCLKAHLERFPGSKSGLNILETNILEIVKNNNIKSKHHVLGYALNYQGYYGFGDIQMARIINKLSIFFKEEEHSLILNRKGHEALLGQYNFSSECNDSMVFGGMKRSDFQYNRQQKKLVKTNINVH